MLGDLVRGVIKSNSRVMNSVLAHEIEGEKKLNEAWGEHAQLTQEMEAKEKKAQEKAEKHKEEIAQLKKEVELISADRDQFRADKDYAEGKLQVNSDSLARTASENLEMKEKVDRVQKVLKKKGEVIGKLRSTNEGLSRGFDFIADVDEERGVLDEQVEKTDLEAKNAKRFRESFEGDVVPKLKRVHEAVSHLRNGDIDTGLKLIGESEKELAPTLSRNQKRQLRRIENKAGKKGCLLYTSDAADE